MTAVIEDPQGKILVMTKGADSTIIPLLKNESKQKDVLKIVERNLESYAKEGLRTLVIAEQEMTSEEYQ